MSYPIDHIGIAVLNLDEAIPRYVDLFQGTINLREEVTSQKTEIAFIQTANTKIELVSPINNEGPIARFIQKRGEGMHHICYQVNDIELELKRLTILGHSLIDQSPRPGAHGTLIAFLHPKSANGTLIEISQKLTS